MSDTKRSKPTAETEVAFAPRQAPAHELHDWMDESGRHELNTGAGVFTPADSAEAAFADQQGWPVTTSTPTPPSADSGAAAEET